MSGTSDILAFSGSLRAGSLNHRLVNAAATEARRLGAEVTVIRLGDYPLPLYNPDDAANAVPSEAHFLKQRFRQHRGLMIASPEYNGMLTGALKNAIDWLSHPEEGRELLDCFEGKVGAIMSAAPGSLGGIRGLPSLRELLSGIGVTVAAQAVAVPRAHTAFDDAGMLSPSRERDLVNKMVEQLVSLLGS